MIEPTDVLYDFPAPADLGQYDLATRKELAFNHLRRVRAVHGPECPNCRRDLTTVTLSFHRALGPGVCITQTCDLKSVELSGPSADEALSKPTITGSREATFSTLVKIARHAAQCVCSDNVQELERLIDELPEALRREVRARV